MSDENTRKASEILIALEAKIDVVSKQVQNLDSNIKLILNRLAVFGAQKQIDNTTSIVPSIVENQELIANKTINKQNISHIANELKKQKDNQIKIKNAEESEKDFDFPQVEINKSDFVPVKKVAIQQRVTYSDGKNICLASVELKNSTGEIIKNTRTNAMGKWIAVVEPGEYFVRIVKSANKTNPEVEMSFPITIPESDRPIELPIPKI